jgi:hypothetical protein
MFIGLSAYQISLVSAQVQSAYKGYEGTAMKSLKNLAYDPLDPSKGAEWLDPVTSPLHTRPMNSILDTSALRTAGQYWYKYWYSTLVTDGALMILVYLLLSSLRKTSLTEVDVSRACSAESDLGAHLSPSQRSAKLTMTFVAVRSTLPARPSLSLTRLLLSDLPRQRPQQRGSPPRLRL